MHALLTMSFGIITYNNKMYLIVGIDKEIFGFPKCVWIINLNSFFKHFISSYLISY